MISIKRNNRGSEILTTPIIIAIGIMLVSSLIVLAVKILSPYIWYEKISATCLKYVFVMEEYGYLTNKEKSKLEKELLNQGFDSKYLRIDYTNKKQKYGSPIFLKISYNYKLELPLSDETFIPMVVSKESVSKI